MAIFAPEHDLRGIAPAGELFDDTVDPVTGVPIFSLYGETRRPTPEMLADIDVLVYDLQDVGARFYTFISTMGLSMQSAADAGIPFVVLDRPNPGGGESSGGFVLEEDQLSFIGQYPIPGSYGLTAGELARAIKGERCTRFPRSGLHAPRYHGQAPQPLGLPRQEGLSLDLGLLVRLPI